MIQKRLTKLLYNVRNISYSDRLKALKLPSLTYRRFRGDMIQEYKLLHKLEDTDYNRFFQMNENHTRGHVLKLKKKSYKKEIHKNFFSSRVIFPWNALPEQVVTASTLNTFKNRLDKLIGGKQFTVFPDNSWVSNRDGDI